VNIIHNRTGQPLPFNARIVLNLTYVLSGIGLSLGLLLYLATIGAEPANPNADDLPHFDYFFHVLGLFFVICTSISLFGNILFNLRYRIGWLILSGVYLVGTVGTLYVLYSGIVIMIKYSLITIPFHLIFLLVVGLIGLYNLFHRETLKIFFTH
jgi:hypothetical protein